MILLIFKFEFLLQIVWQAWTTGVSEAMISR